MNGKPFELGLIVGRFQTFHKGHQQIVDKALELCARVGVFIGSSQESGTVANPFPYGIRKTMLRRIYGDRAEIYPLRDIGVGNVSLWGDYVMRNAEQRFGRLPDLLVSGREERRADWLDGSKWRGVSELYVPKTVDISASAMRAFLTENDIGSWREYTDPRLWEYYDELRGYVLLAQGNNETESI